MAEAMFDSVLDELDGLFDAESVIDQMLGPAKGPLKWMFKRVLKSSARALGSVVGAALESDGSIITVNGQQMSGREFKEWRASKLL